MEHEFHLVDILNAKGEVIGQKPRRELDKSRDIHHTAFVLLITPAQKAVLGLIPAREDLPNLYANQYGTTIATVRRHDEDIEQAARRGVSRELFVDDVQPELIGESMEEFEGGRKQIVSFFTLESEMPDEFSLTDVQQLRPMSRAEIETKLERKPSQFAPTFRRIWEKYSLMIRI
jgi:isopentenyldiphosphate isomerase